MDNFDEFVTNASNLDALLSMRDVIDAEMLSRRNSLSTNKKVKALQKEVGNVTVNVSVDCEVELSMDVDGVFVDDVEWSDETLWDMRHKDLKSAKKQLLDKLKTVKQKAKALAAELNVPEADVLDVLFGS